MAIAIQGLEASVAAMQAEVTRARTIGAGAIAALKNVGATIKAAVDADTAIGQAETDRVKGIVDAVIAAATADNDALEAAVLANTPPPPPAG